MKKSNNQLHIDGETQPIVYRRNYANTPSNNSNPFSKNSKFAKTAAQLEIPVETAIRSRDLMSFLSSRRVGEGDRIQGKNIPPTTQTHRRTDWTGILRDGRLEITESRWCDGGRISPKGCKHLDGLSWLESDCDRGKKAHISLGGEG